MGTHRTLVPTDVLAAHLDDPSWVVVDCRFELADPDAGAHAYADAHIPGAAHADLDRDLSGPTTGGTGRHPLPAPQTMVATFGRLGIGPGRQVVAYDQSKGTFASRLWWMLRYAGHDAVAVLDGGWAKWRRDERPERGGVESPRAQSFTAAWRPEMLIDAAAVLAGLGDPERQLLDARAPERFTGSTEPLDPVAGHIPGAVNHPCLTNVGEDGTFLQAEELRRRFETRLGRTTPDQVVSYCGSGVTACHNLLALAHAGLDGGRLYAGSWSEWCSDPARPIVTGDEPS